MLQSGMKSSGMKVEEESSKAFQDIQCRYIIQEEELLDLRGGQFCRSQEQRDIGNCQQYGNVNLNIYN